jgi:hypothetical protein
VLLRDFIDSKVSGNPGHWPPGVDCSVYRIRRVHLDIVDHIVAADQVDADML